MRINWLILPILVGISCGVIAQDEDLILAFSRADGSHTYIDKNSIQKTGNSIRYWEVTKFASPNKYNVIVQRTFMEIDCNARMRAQRAFVDYSPSGEVVASDNTLNEAPRWRPIVPGSNGEIIRRMVCS